MVGSEPLVAVTMGDPAGIGPEIVAKTFADTDFAVPAVVIGDPGVLSSTLDTLKLPVRICEIERPIEATRSRAVIPIIPASELGRRIFPGTVDACAGQAAYDYIARAVDFALSGDVAAIATAPINKEALRAAGIGFPGHTEILAALTGTKDFAMMLFNDELKVVLVTVHVSLRQAIGLLSEEAELRAIRLAGTAAQHLGIGNPRVAVAGLNPHAGEGGLFGEEDRQIIAPAVARARKEGIDATGPWPGDTVFMQARQGRFDIVVAQYHDQGLIPVKYLGIEQGVNATLGLPFIRTSVDHGTAFDIAGTGRADHTSLKTAIEWAARMASSRGRSAPDRQGTYS